MLSEAELLPTIAEIAVVYAGFASLISVFGGISSRDQIAVNFWRLRGMLETSAMTLVFSLAPFVPAKFGVSSALSWRIAAAVFGVLVIVRIAYKVVSLIKPSLLNPLVAWSLAIVQFLAAILLLGSAIWLSENMVIGAYHLLIFVMLLLSAYHFIRVAASVLAIPSEES